MQLKFIRKKMEYIKVETEKDYVNKRGSRIWLKMNDNSKAAKNRQQFVDLHGGFFVKNGRYWHWNSPIVEKNGYWLKNIVSNEKTFFTSMSEFGKKHGLSSVKICELLNGKRKTYKGWTAVETRAVKDTTGQHFKEKEEKQKLIKVSKVVHLLDVDTNNVLTITNIKQFAKTNNLDPSAFYKLINGKAKQVKNFKLYTPLS